MLWWQYLCLWILRVRWTPKYFHISLASLNYNISNTFGVENRFKKDREKKEHLRKEKVRKTTIIHHLQPYNNYHFSYTETSTFIIHKTSTFVVITDNNNIYHLQFHIINLCKIYKGRDSSPSFGQCACPSPTVMTVTWVCSYDGLPITHLGWLSFGLTQWQSCL